MDKQDYMLLAIKEAEKAKKKNEVPIGAIIVKDGKVLLGEKLRGFGKGKFNGVGGKVESNETIEEGMLRETKEEFAIVPKNYSYVGNVFYDEFKGDEKIYYDTAIFVATDFEGEPKTTDEMKPVWFDIDKIANSDVAKWIKDEIAILQKRIMER